MLNSYFKFKENGTDLKTEIIGGITTFLAMAYTLGINPTILSKTGMPETGVFFATAIASGIAWGFIIYSIGKIATGKFKETNLRIYVLAIVFGFYIFFGIWTHLCEFNSLF